jgi:WhiB family redox-sensing transcriptional regulator
MDTEMWFPVHAGPRLRGAELKRVLAAKAVCGSCPVRSECLEYAAATGQRGIWGGLTEEQRRTSRLCRKLRAAALAS